MLVIVLEGSAKHIVNNEEYPVSKGDVFVINQFTAHSYVNANHLKICNIMFRPEEVFANVYDMKKMTGFQALFILEPHYSQNHHFCSQLHLSASEFNLVLKQLQEIMEVYCRKDVGWKDYVFSKFSLFCIMLSEFYNTVTLDSSNEFIKLAGAAAHIENHYCSDITTEELAKIAGYSSRQFQRLFKAVFSTTPNFYIVELRMKKAQQLLKSSNATIGEIAWNCGYDDQNYFSRLFKKHTGMTPSDFRQHIKH